MNKTLKITLLSDLCAATGKHYAAMIDTDTALDEYGLPYIPSRRLKGCLREVADYFLDDGDLGRIFGSSGSDASGSLRIGNAFIEDYEKHVDAFKNASDFSPSQVSELYCSVRGQTAIEDEHAKDQSLRFTRVVNRIDPVSGAPLSFYSEISFDDSDYDAVSKMVRGLRNIGYRRARGLGHVACELADSEKTASIDEVIIEENENCCLRLSVKLEDDLMLPDTDANHSQDYISGTMVLGALASAFVKKNGERGFNDIFFSDVSFGNLYPALLEDGQVAATVPAPRFLAKVKAAVLAEDIGVKNLLCKDDADGKIYKPIKSGYVTAGLRLIKPEEKIVYHNSNVKSSEQLLYMQYCICSGQYFSGTISGPAEKLNQIARLLYEAGELRFGRSKTAQYSLCRIVELKKEKDETELVMLKQGVPAAYVLESDVALTDKNGVYVNSADALCEALGVDQNTVEWKYSGLSSRIYSGYNAKWNLKKPQHPVISAGSSIVFIPASDMEISKRRFIGEKLNEGFGRVTLIADAASIKASKAAAKAPETGDVSDAILLKLKENRLSEGIISKAVSKANSLKLDASQVGRLALMLKEADRAESSYDDFIARIKSIKSEDKMEKALKVFGRREIEKVFGGEVPMEWKYIREYAHTLLTVKKYRLRAGGNDNE